MEGEICFKRWKCFWYKTSGRAAIIKKGDRIMTRLTTCKTVRFISTLMVAVLLATCLPLTVFGANEEDLLPEITQTENAIDSGSVRLGS